MAGDIKNRIWPGRLGSVSISSFVIYSASLCAASVRCAQDGPGEHLPAGLSSESKVVDALGTNLHVVNLIQLPTSRFLVGLWLPQDDGFGNAKSFGQLKWRLYPRSPLF